MIDKESIIKASQLMSGSCTADYKPPKKLPNETRKLLGTEDRDKMFTVTFNFDPPRCTDTYYDRRLIFDDGKDRPKKSQLEKDMEEVKSFMLWIGGGLSIAVLYITFPLWIWFTLFRKDDEE